MNFLNTAIRNALKANKHQTKLKKFKNITEILEILKNYHYIYDYETLKNNKVCIFLNYSKFKPSISNITYFAKTLYFSNQDLWKFEKDLGLLILSTSYGVLTHKEALKKKIGGKALIYVF